MKLHAALLAAALALPCAAVAQTATQSIDTLDPALKAKIDRIATGVMEQHGVPSASIAVLEHGKLAYTHGYGLAHIHTGNSSGPDVPATPEMRYAIGSISKQFTAAAILLLQEDGKLKLDDPVGKYIPGLTRGDEVTIRQVLSHTSGYQDYWPEDYLMTPMMKPATAQSIVDAWAKKPLDFEPGTQWQYSNTNYVIAGLIIEKVSGEKVFEFIGKRIFHPLGMKSVYNYDEAGLTATDAAPYIRAALGPLRPAPKEGRGWMFAAGEIAMTPHDLALWNESLIAQPILKPDSYKEMFTSIKLKGGPKDGQDTHYGLGVFIRNFNGHRVIEHSGEVTGFVAESLLLPDDGISVIALTNHMAGGAGQIGQLVADAVLGVKKTDAETQALAIYRGLQKGEIDHSLLAPNLNDYFDAQTVKDFQTSLAPLGEPLTFQQTGESLRGGMTEHTFRITYPTRRLSLSTYAYPDGKLEQYLVSPAD
jgi:CubicO group peptidase (beta-lactamase class C family)